MVDEVHSTLPPVLRTPYKLLPTVLRTPYTLPTTVLRTPYRLPTVLRPPYALSGTDAGMLLPGWVAARVELDQ